MSNSTINFSKDHLYSLLKDQGYSLDIEETEDSFNAYGTHRFWVNERVFIQQYSKEYTEHEIELDSVDALLKASGLKVVIALDY